MSEVDQPILIPPVGLKSTICRTPNDGLLYIGSRYKEVIYIAAPDAQRMFPKFKVMCAPAKIFFEYLAVDPIWEEHRQEFTVISERFKIFVLDIKSQTTVKSHHVHLSDKKQQNSRGGQFAFCYTHNRHILSVDRQTFVNFDVDANTYTSQTTGWFVKHHITTMAASPHNTDLFAAGTKSGLVLIASLKRMVLVYQMRGHDAEIKSLSWTMAMTSQSERLKVPTPPPTKKTKTYAAEPQADDDLFDVYSYEHLENEFGTYADNNLDPESDEESKMANKVEIVEGNDKFDFVEACSNLKDMILQTDDATAPVTTDIDELCAKVEHIFDENAVPPTAETFQSVPPPGSSDIATSNVSCTSNLSGMASPPEVIEAIKRMLLVSSCSKGVAWVWDAETGEALEKFKIAQPRGTVKATTKLLWIGNDTLLSLADQIQLWKLGFADNNRLTIKQIIRDFNAIEHTKVGTCSDKFAQAGSCIKFWIQQAGLHCIETDGDEIRELLAVPPLAMEVQAIEVNQLESNLVALTSFKQIYVLNMSNISANRVDKCIQIAPNIQSAVYALAWHPQKANVLAFSTKEGQIGIVNINKPSSVVYMKPKFTCTVYSLTWGSICDHQTNVATIVPMCCAKDDIVYFMESGERRHEAISLRLNASHPKHIKVTDRLLFIGTNEGYLFICDLHDRNKFLYGRVLGKKYIASIDTHRNKVAVSTMCGKVQVVDITTMDDVTLTTFEGHTDGVVSVRFSADGTRMVSTSYDGTVRVWDTNDPTSCQVFKFPCFMYAAVFSALNPNIVVCGGIQSGTIILDITSDTKDVRPFYCQFDHLLSSKACVDECEASGEGSSAALKSNKRNRRNRGVGDNAEHIATGAGKSTQQDVIFVSDEARPELVEAEQQTMLYLCTKEMNREPLNVLKRCIERQTEDAEVNVQRKLLNEQFFSSRECLRLLLVTELQNSKQSTAKSAGNLLLPQITGHLKEEILQRLMTKTMTDEYLALAPNVSYVFWRDCCKAYGLQLIEKGMILKAITYLWSSNDINETIQQLCAANYFREAYCVARLRKEDDDPVFATILGKWSQQFENNGALEAAATIACVNRDFASAKCILEKRRVLTAEHEQVLSMLSKLV